MLSIIKNKTKIPFSCFYFLPVFISIPIGGIIGGYDGFKETKHKSLDTNIFITTLGIMNGLSIGGLLGLIWPISISVLTARTLSKISVASIENKSNK
jgi:hypothetical protein